MRSNVAKFSDQFVNPERIKKINSLEVDQFDFSRLIGLCEELNYAKQNGSYQSVAILSRALIDHIPPIFNCKSFKEVANNYGTKSFQESMTQLNKSSRKIADGYLHTQIRKKESLPNFTQVNFSQSIDLLLSEIIRTCGESYT